MLQIEVNNNFYLYVNDYSYGCRGYALRFL